MNLGIRPFNGKRCPPQGILCGNRPRITEAIAQGCRIWTEAIRVGEGIGQLQPCVLAELHEDTQIVREGKVQTATCDGRLQRLLHRLLGVKPHRRI